MGGGGGKGGKWTWNIRECEAVLSRLHTNSWYMNQQSLGHTTSINIHIHTVCPAILNWPLPFTRGGFPFCGDRPPTPTSRIGVEPRACFWDPW